MTPSAKELPGHKTGLNPPAPGVSRTSGGEQQYAPRNPERFAFQIMQYAQTLIDRSERAIPGRELRCEVLALRLDGGAEAFAPCRQRA